MLGELRPDAINVHNLHMAVIAGFSPELLRACRSHAPTVWTLHDMWSFTGRCAYSYDCRKFLTGCDSTCPTPHEYPALAPGRIAGAWQMRKQLFDEHRELVAVTPSGWLAKEAAAGLWQEHRVEVIPNGLPLDVFRPLDRAESRKALGIDADGPVLLVAAQNLAERRKGGALLAEALRLMGNAQFTLITLGARSPELPSDNVRILSLGFVGEQRKLVQAYSAADVFVHPAPADNLPNVVMEAIACGTPVVSFAVGGLPDMVRPSQTGWLAQEVTAKSLADALKVALNELERGANLTRSCLAVAEAEYSVDLQARRYAALFEEMKR